MESFLTACGAAGPLTLEIEGPGLHGVELRTFARPFVLIGRDDRADLLFDHDLISRRHAYLQVIEGRLFFVDLDSRAGTFLGESPADSGWLSPGLSLGIGPYTVRPHAPEAGPRPAVGSYAPTGSDSGFEFQAIRPAAAGEEGLPQSPLLARSSDAADLPRVSLEFQSRTAGHSVWRMSQVLALVGSSPRCKVRLLDSNVSKLHCALLRTPQGLWVVDLLGRGGITVNGTTARSARLAADDVLGLGQVIVRPNFEDPNAPGNAPSGATGVWGSTPPGAGLPALTSSAPQGLAPRVWGQPPAPVPAPAHGYPNATRPPAATELSAGEPGLSLLLNHFGQMQQQMIDQFQSSMMMMMQMFNGMHRDQMGLVREELDRLHELSNEVQQLKAQLAAPPPAANPAVPPGPAPWQGYARGLPGRAGASPAGPPPRPEPPRGTNGTPAGSYWPPAPTPAPAAAAPGQPPAAPGVTAPPDPEVHDWLNARLVAITQEQQTRWQKIMGLLRNGK